MTQRSLKKNIGPLFVLSLNVNVKEKLLILFARLYILGGSYSLVYISKSSKVFSFIFWDSLSYTFIGWVAKLPLELCTGLIVYSVVYEYKLEADS